MFFVAAARIRHRRHTAMRGQTTLPRKCKHKIPTFSNFFKAFWKPSAKNRCCGSLLPQHYLHHNQILIDCKDLQAAVFGGGVEAGAGFGGEIAVAVDRGAGETAAQRREEAKQRLALGRGACIGRAAVAADASHIAHSHRPTVVPAAMGSGHRQTPATFHRSVKPHHKMVPDIGKSSFLLMPAAYVGCSHIAPGRRGRAMHYHFGYPPFAQLAIHKFLKFNIPGSHSVPVILFHSYI